MLNPAFATSGFQPDPAVEYRCSVNTTSTGFNFLHALVLGGPDRLVELELFIKQHPVEFTRQAQQRNTQGWTALMLAARNSRADSTERTVDLLLPHSDAKQQTKEGSTALMLAARYSRTTSTEHTVELLLPHSDAKQQNKDGWTALMLAARNSRTTSTEHTV